MLDWSGTLVDDLPAVLEASNHVFRRAGVPEMDQAEFRARFSLPFQHFYDAYVPHVALAQLEAWFHERFREVQDSVEPLPHAGSFLEYCRSCGLDTCLLSTVHPEHFRVQAARIGFGRYLDRIETGIPDKRVRIGELLLEQGWSPAETVFVGDMQHDVDAARAGAVHGCAVLTGYNSLSQLRASQPELVVEHLEELRGLWERAELDWDRAVTLQADRRPTPTVGALIRRGDGRVLLIRTRKWSDRWGIPGGKIKSGESSEAALRREILEETGLVVEDLRFVLTQDCIDSHEFYRPAHFLLLNYTARSLDGDLVTLNEEAQAYLWVEPEEALAMDLNRPTRVLLEALNVNDENGKLPPSRPTESLLS